MSSLVKISQNELDKMLCHHQSSNCDFSDAIFSSIDPRHDENPPISLKNSSFQEAILNHIYVYDFNIFKQANLDDCTFKNGQNISTVNGEFIYHEPGQRPKPSKNGGRIKP